MPPLFRRSRAGLPVTFTLNSTGSPTAAGSPNPYLPGNGVLRPNAIMPADQIAVQNWTIGDRFNNKLKNPLWNINAFGNPAPFTAGNLGRNMINGPGLNWTQTSLAKNIVFKERYVFQVRYDINNVFKQPNFVNPSSVVNLKSPGLFGKPTATTRRLVLPGGSVCQHSGAQIQFLTRRCPEDYLKIDKAVATHVRVPFVEPFRISSGCVAEKDAIILELHSDGLTGYGESSAMAGSFYSADTPEKCWSELCGFVLPAIVGREFECPENWNLALDGLRRGKLHESRSRNCILGSGSADPEPAAARCSWRR